MYRYTGSLAAATLFVPPAGTIVFMAAMEFVVLAINDWFFNDATLAGNPVLADSFAQNIVDDKNVMQGIFMCDGVRGFYNDTGGARDILLLGVSMT